MTGTRYRIGDEIGRGALGRVVVVHDESTGDALAGKILHDSHRDDPSARERFANEAAILRDLDHPNVVRVIGLEDIDGTEVLLMERIDGDTLEARIARDAPLVQAALVDLGVGIADGLAAAHHAGLIHRDLKPANVLLTRDGVPKIVDFGLARASSFEGVGAGAFAIVGTPDYMAPESIDPLAVDPRSDVYALGCILFELATGRPPYTAPTAFALLEAHRDRPIPAVEPNAGLSAPVVELIAWMLAKSPADRPQSATVVGAALRRAAQPSGGGALVPARDAELFGGRCADCGEPLIARVPVCFGCGLEQPGLEPGDHSVFVVGPGELTEKIDSQARQRLLDWLRANPMLGLDPTPLAHRVPRLPFVVATDLSEPSAERLVRSLKGLGFECAIREGGRFALREVRSKAWRLGGRVAAIVAGSTAYMMTHTGLLLVPFAIAGAVGSLVAGWSIAGRRIARQRPPQLALPPAIAGGLDRVAGVVPVLEARRHRESLRAVVQRVLTLRAYLEERGRDTFDDDLARLLDLAVVASSRLDELETALEGADMRDPSDELRLELRERDMWAARLLETTAFLDALRVRYAAAGATRPDATAEELDDLRRCIAALQEVEAL